MASKTTSLFLYLSLLLSFSMPNSVIAFIKIPAIFAFGDSTIDPGNNNNLDTVMRCDHLPYGRDFPNKIPTGRFSNGKIPTDFLSQILGIKDLLPAFLDPQVTDNDLLTGVSFASGGTGLDNQTATSSKVLNLDAQFELFEQALLRIRKIVGNEKANEIIHNAWYAVSIGTNDMLYNVYLTQNTPPHGSISSYQDFLLQNLQNFIQRLYGAGARRIMVAGLPPLGCLPIQETIDSITPNQHWLQRVCNDQHNIDSQIYNTKLQSIIHQLLQTTLHDAKIAYFDIYTPLLDMVLYPTKYGLENSQEGCCGTGTLEMGLLCNELDMICSDPSKYLFWDAVHPTQKGHSVIVNSGRQTIVPYLTS